MYASRNISNCTKDCICLFVCPTGATDTETGQIDSSRCIDGCRLCVDACPSHAIYLVMDNYPEPAPKDRGLSDKLLKLCRSKYQQESALRKISLAAETPASIRMAKALRLSFRVASEDYAREGGYMLPQSRAVAELLGALLEDASPEAAEEIRVILDS